MVFKTTDNLKAMQYFVGKWAELDPAHEYTIDIKRYSEKRSLNANSYAWVLINRLADALSKGGDVYSRDDMYIEMLKSYGQSFIVKIPNKSVGNFERATKYWERHEKLDDENAVYYRVFVGSSNYDTDEMYTFTQGIVHECKQLGIETKTPDELARMIKEWGDEKTD